MEKHKRKNHKWVDNHTSSQHHKNQTCSVCGYSRQRHGGPWQMWEYYKDEKQTYKRPYCI